MRKKDKKVQFWEQYLKSKTPKNPFFSKKFVYVGFFWEFCILKTIDNK